jgi:hypothetical protein
MEEIIKDYTHKNVYIEDIRLKRSASKKNDFFALKVEGIDSTIYVNYSIFNERIRSFYLGKNVEDISRDNILNLKWNFVITQGSYLKIVDNENFERIGGVPEKWYISIFEVATTLGKFSNNFAETVYVNAGNTLNWT